MNSREKHEQLVRHYAGMADGELEELAREGGELTEMAREALRAEIARRGLTMVVREPEPSSSHSESRLVTVGTFISHSPAMIAQTILESAGIECVISGEHMIGAGIAFSTTAGDGIRLQVAEENAEAAKALLEAEIPEKFIVSGVGEFVQPRCPECESLDTFYERREKGVTRAADLVGVPIPVHSWGWRCNACGHEWTGEPK